MQAVQTVGTKIPLEHIPSKYDEGVEFKEQALGWGRAGGLDGLALTGRYEFVDCGEIQEKGGALSKFAGNADGSRALPDDTIAGGQPNPVPLPTPLVV